MLPTIDRLPRRSRYSSAMWYPAAGLVCLRRRDVEVLGLRAATVPVASSSATRVSPRSTLTSTCFFNCVQSFGVGPARHIGGGTGVGLGRPLGAGEAMPAAHVV